MQRSVGEIGMGGADKARNAAHGILNDAVWINLLGKNRIDENLLRARIFGQKQKGQEQKEKGTVPFFTGLPLLFARMRYSDVHSFGALKRG